MSRKPSFTLIARGVLLLGALRIPASVLSAGEQSRVSLPDRGGKKAGDPFAAGNCGFALDLYRQVRSKGENLFFSPFSISEALAMAWVGARGETALQIARTLHLDAAKEEPHEAFRTAEARLRSIQARGKVELAIANSLWPQAGEPLLPKYLSTLSTSFGAEPTAVDYRKNPEAARISINEWVGKKTRERIPNLLPDGSLDSDTRLVLVNAIFFKGKWSHRFDKALTKNEPFHAVLGRTVSVPLMRTSVRAGYLETDGAQILQLPYEGDDLSLVVLLPRKTDGLAELEDRLKAEDLMARLSSVNMARLEVDVWLPRFRMDSAFRLRAKLASLGLVDAFDRSKANFEGMNGRRGLFISEGFHEAFVDVNEEGTEAAAATGLVAALPSVPPPNPVFRADHPFLFLIRDNATGIVLFLGRVVDPTR